MRYFDFEIGEYAKALDIFALKKELPYKLLAHLDHIAIKAANSDNFEVLVERFRPEVEQKKFVCVEKDGRRLASAPLLGEISLGSFATVGRLGIMERRPGTPEAPRPIVDHTESSVKDLEGLAEIVDVLDLRGIEFEVQADSSRICLCVIINEDGQELKFTDKALEDITA